MHRRFSAVLAPVVAGALALVGCQPVDTTWIPSVPVQEATLERARLRTSAFLGGGVNGAADLHLVDAEGTRWRFPVRLRGGTVGLGLEFSLGLGRDLPLILPDAEITGEMLLDRYVGNSNGLVAGLGVQTRHLRNPHDVRISGPFADVGASAMISVEWLTIRLDEPEDTFDSGYRADTRSAP